MVVLLYEGVRIVSRTYFFQARFCFVSSKVKVLTCMQEAGTGFASKPQTDDAEPGDIALDSWVRTTRITMASG